MVTSVYRQQAVVDPEPCIGRVERFTQFFLTPRPNGRPWMFQRGSEVLWAQVILQTLMHFVAIDRYGVRLIVAAVLLTVILLVSYFVHKRNHVPERDASPQRRV